jgi:hypothetical protein
MTRTSLWSAYRRPRTRTRTRTPEATERALTKRGRFNFLDFRQNGFFDLPDFGLIALVEDPLLDSFGAGHPGLAENSHVFARGRLTYAKLARNQAAANAVLHQIAIDLRRKVLCRFFKPLKNL